MKRLFQLWQPSKHEYRLACHYLGLTPSDQLFERLTTHLATAPFRFGPPRGFALHLARLRKTSFRLARLDLVTKYLYPAHPVRHLLNAIIALHECDATGYRELSAAPTGWQAPLKLATWGGSFAFSALLTLPWLAWHGIVYLFGPATAPLEALQGKHLLITGVSRGLGRDLMLFALQQGARVTGTLRNRAAILALRDEVPADAPLDLVEADLSQSGSLVKALQEHGLKPEMIDVAILCAGTKLSDTSILNTSALRQTFEINTFSSMELASWYCASSQSSTLVLISSMGRWHGMHSSCGYNASKAALSIWGESLEMEMAVQGRHKCSVLVVEPGLFKSDMVEEGGLGNLLAVSREGLALRILSGAMSGRKAMRPPLWFALLTWGTCLGGRKLRSFLFARAKKKGET